MEKDERCDVTLVIDCSEVSNEVEAARNYLKHSHQFKKLHSKEFKTLCLSLLAAHVNSTLKNKGITPENCPNVSLAITDRTLAKWWMHSEVGKV